MNSATILRVNGETEQLDHKPSLEEAQSAVKGYVEALTVVDRKDGKRKQMLVNEEGAIRGLHVNMRATYDYTHMHGQARVIVGDVVILEGWRF